MDGSIPFPVGWVARELPQAELLLPSGGPRVVEARAETGGVPVGVLLRDDDGPLELNTRDGAEEFLRRVAPGLAPLAVALTLVRYRIAALLGEPSVRLATGPEDLHPSLRDRGLPLDLAVDGDRIAFTTAFVETWAGRAGADRWTAILAEAARPALEGAVLAREELG